MSEILKRALTGAVFVLILVGSILGGEWYLGGLFLLVTGMGSIEFGRMASKLGYQTNMFLSVILSISVYALIWSPEGGKYNQLLTFSATIFAVLAVLAEMKKNKPRIENLALTFFSVIYWAIPMACLLSVSTFFGYYDYQLLLGFFIMLWCNDTGAYLVGSLMGKNKLAPKLSPKKTWEGFIGGGLLSLIAAYVISLFFENLDMSSWLTIGGIVFLLATPGDLLESLIKRNFGVKDSGKILPGHGGVMDRFDGVVLSIPVILCYLYLVH